MDHTKKTLLEQLQLNEFEIARRKELLGFTTSDADLLLSCKGLVSEHIDSIVADFYAKQTAIPEIALLIGDADTLGRLHSAQRGYVLGLFEGFYDVDYVNNRLRIGMVHKRIGVEPKLYLSAVKTLKDTINAALFLHIDDGDQANLVVNALDKLLYFDNTLIFDTYIRALLSEVESAKDKVLSYAGELEAKVADRTRQLQELSQHDSLTDLYNQRAMNELLRRQFSLAKRQGNAFSFAYLDVDKFKQINDTNGHFAGDEVLRQVALALKKVCRNTDIPCRYGGDEFCLILPDSTLTDAEIICQRLIDQFSATVPGVTLSIGIAQAGPDDFSDADTLLHLADAKMYEAKGHPSSKICL
jgi:diguanylate cyclase